MHVTEVAKDNGSIFKYSEATRIKEPIHLAQLKLAQSLHSFNHSLSDKYIQESS